jgi:mannose-binding lectin 2
MVNGPVFGNMDYFQGLAIILDTYSNHNGPHNVSHVDSNLRLHLVVVKYDFFVMLQVLVCIVFHLS